MVHSNVVNALLVDKVDFWPDFRLASPPSLSEYSLIMDDGDKLPFFSDDPSDCPCLLPPPDFDIGPPPKPFFLNNGEDGGEDIFQDDSTCPLQWPGFVSNTIVPNERTSVSEPLIFIITATAVMALALIIFTIMLVWCQRKGWCKRTTKLSATFSSDTEESTTCYSTGVGRKTDWSFNGINGEKQHLPQGANVGIIMYGAGNSQPQRQIIQNSNGANRLITQRPLPTLPRAVMTPSVPKRPPLDRVLSNGSYSLTLQHKRYQQQQPSLEILEKNSDSHILYDSHNPVYEEISLNGQCPVHNNHSPRQDFKLAGLVTNGHSTNLDHPRHSIAATSSESPCSCQSCSKSASIDNMELDLEEDEDNLTIDNRHLNEKSKISTINQSTQSEETFLNNDEENYCESQTNNGRESGYGTEGYPVRDNFGTWDSPKRVSPPTMTSSGKGPPQKKGAPSSLWVTSSESEKSKRSGVAGPFAVFSGPNSAYV